MKKILILTIIFLISKGCLDIRSCNTDLIGKYSINNDSSIINYLELNEDGTFLHYYKYDDVELLNNGNWKKSKDDYCYIELEGWKNYNEKGIDFDKFMIGILYINGIYLDISPDGESSTSFKRE